MPGGLSLLLSVVALAFAVVAWNRMVRESQRLDELTRRLNAMSDVLVKLLRERQTPPPAAPPQEQPQQAPIPPPPRVTAAPPVPGGHPLKPEPAQVAPPPPPPSPEGGPASSPPPATAVSLEEKLTLRVFVWIAAVALALAGGYLVKYSFDNNILTAPVRISIAVLGGIGMIAAGEFMLRRAVRIAQALSAAGVATLFAAILAAVHVEHLSAPSVGFVAMAAVAGVAVVLSLRHGQLVAILGLAGGFLTPAIIQTGNRSAPMLFGYLFVLQMALLLVTRRRGWWPLTMLTLALGYAWAFVWLFFFFHPGDETALGLFLLGTSAAFVLAPMTAAATADGDPVVRHLIRGVGAAVGLLLGAVMLPVGQFTTIEWVYFGVLGAGCVAVAMFDVRSRGLAWLAAAAAAAVLVMYRSGSGDLATFTTVTVLYGTLYAAGAYLGMWVVRTRRGEWAMLSVLAAAAYFTVAWWGIDVPPFARFWGVMALVLAAVYAVASWPMLGRAGAETAAAALLLGAIGFVAAAVPLELERQWIAVAWALLVPVAIEIGRRLRVPQMRAAAAVLTAGVIVRLLLNPGVLHYPIGVWPVLNWLLYGYGVPAAALALAARRVRADDESAASFARGFGVVAIGLGLAMVTLMVRHGFHRTELLTQNVTLPELATYGLAWASMGVALLLATGCRKGSWVASGGTIVAAIGLSLSAALLCLSFNPLWHREAVGATRVFNGLLYIYGVPALAAMATAAVTRRLDPKAAAWPLVVGLVMLFALVTLQVRHWFQGPLLVGDPASALTHAENYAYSAAWLLYGLGLLVAGIVARAPALRWASLAVVMLSVAKVFLWDMAHLRDLYRVLSFFGLGVSLLGLAWLYQQFVFRRAEAEE